MNTLWLYQELSHPESLVRANMPCDPATLWQLPHTSRSHRWLWT